MPLGGPPRVLILVEQPLLAGMITLTLNHGMFVTRGTTTALEAITLVDEWRPHLAVIDMDIAGEELIDRLGQMGPDTGIRTGLLALTRRGDLAAKLEAFERGADDIMTVPFSPEELLARMVAITRRTFGDPLAIDPVLRLGEIEIDILHRQVRAGTSELHLSGIEQSLLYLLAANAGQVVTRDQILDVLWGTDYVAESNVVDWHVRNLRARLQNDWRKPRFIETVPGKGYRFLPTFSETQAPSDVGTLSG